MKPRVAALFVVAALVLVTAVVFAQGTTKWPMYRHDFTRSGKAEPDALPDNRLSPIWVFPLPELAGGAIDNDVMDGAGNVTKDQPNFDFVGTWHGGDSLMAPNGYNGNFLYTPALVSSNPETANATATATWEFKLANQRGSQVAYYAYAWFPSHAYAEQPMHATRARYTVEIVDDSGTVAFSQNYYVDQSSGGNWVPISTSAFLVRDDQWVRVIVGNVVPEDDTQTIVCADAVMLSHDVGSVLSSPAFAPNDPATRDDDLVVTATAENRPLQMVTTLIPDTDEFGNARRDNNGNVIMKKMTVQSGSIRVSALYGLYAEKQGSAAVDERGTAKWSFPYSTDNWIAGGFSSSPVIQDYGGTEAAYCAAKDGQIYVVDTRNTVDGTPNSEQKVIWQGPGYIAEPTGSWPQVFSAGRQGLDFLRTDAVKEGDAGESTVSWKVNPQGEGSYSVYAWIPPSATDAIGIPDAKYKVTVGTKEYNATADQRSGGRWALLGKYDVQTSDDIDVTLSNVSEVMKGTSPGPRVVSADAIKVVPAALGIFDWSSPAVSADGKEIYIGTTTGRLYCFRIGDPEPAWVYPAVGTNPVGAIYTSPTLYENSLYFGSADGRIYKVSTNGTLDWVYPEPPKTPTDPLTVFGEISTSVAISDEGSSHLLYFGVGSNGLLPPMASGDPMTGRVICLKETTGGGGGPGSGGGVDIEWVYPDPNNPDSEAAEARGSFLYSSPLIFDTGLAVGQTMAIGSSDGSLIGLDRMGGTELPSWADGFPDLGDAIYSSAAGVMVNKLGVMMPMAYVGTQNGSLKSVDLRTGVKSWSYGLTGAVASSPAVAEDRLYVGDMNGLTWAFSARAGSGTDDHEEWNHQNHRIDTPPGNPNDSDGTNTKESKVEVDLFYRADWEAIRDGVELPKAGINDGDLHLIARAERDGNLSNQQGHNHHPAFPYEWGETVYIIAWGCLDPNDANDSAATWVKGGKRGAKYVPETDSTVRLTIKSRGPGDESDQSTALTMTEKGSFMDKDGKVIYYAKYAYVLGTSSSSSTQAPGSRITVSVQELPSTNSNSVNKGSSAGDCIVPEHPIPKKKDAQTGEDVYDHAKYVPQRITINNPLALAYTDPMTSVTELIGVDSSWNTSHDVNNPNSLVHANDNHGHVPSVRAGLVAHGTNSDEKLVDVCDRSLLFQTGSRLGKFRVERSDLEWNGGPDQIWKVGPASARVSTALPWELPLPPMFASGHSDDGNSSLDYPDIRMRQVGYSMAESRLDPTQEEAVLRPGNGGSPAPPVSDLWQVGRNPLAQVISVPRHQPANMPSTWPTSNAAVLNSTGFIGHSYVFIDSNGDGRLNRGGSLGSSQLYQQSVSGARSEAYRRVHSQVYVPPDYRVDVAEKTYDIGAVPHGFGLTATGSLQPRPFYPTLGENVRLILPGGSPTNPVDPYLDPHFKSFTAYNDGNVNMMNLRMAKFVNPPTGYSYPLDLYSDTAEGNVYPAGNNWLGSYGAFVPSAGVVSALDPRFLTNDSRNLRPIMGLQTRTFHKPRVGESASVLRIPDMPTRLWNDPTFGFDPSYVDPKTNKPSPLIPSLPFFSVAVPVGTPVGTYSRSLTLFEDLNNNDVFDPGESVGNPVMEAKVTVTENRMTDGFMPGARPQVDVPPPGSKVSIGDVSPAAYMDSDGNLQMFWSSSRLNGQGTAGDPWYIYKSGMPWVPGTATSSGYWTMASPTPGSDQWWTSIASSYPIPDKDTLKTFFSGGPGEIQMNSVKFTSPSIAKIPTGCGACPPKAYLFFGGEAVRHQDAVSPKPEIKDHEYKAFYWALDDNGVPTGNALSSTRDWTMPKYGVRGVGAVVGDPARTTLWTFWYGGNNSQWRIYYNVSPLKATDTVGDPASWSNDGRLPLPRGLSSAAEPSLISRKVREEDGDLIGVIEVVYSAYSQYHKNTDIYLTRYEPDFDDVSNGVVAMDIVDLPTVHDEVLTRDPASAIYSSRHVDWNENHMVVRCYYDPADPTKFDRIDVGTPTRDSQTHALIYTYEDPAYAAQRSRYRSVVIDTESGTVKFLRDPGKDAVITATYRPRAYRLTTDGAADTGPCALWDNSWNPRADTKMYPNSFWYPSNWSGGPPSTDRLWTLWRRPTTVMKGTGVFYKSFRYTIRLNQQIAKDAIGSLSFGPSDPAGPVEIDWAKKRLYFTWVDEGKDFTITYPDAMGNDITETATVRMEEELDAYGNAFGNLTSEVSNEGQVCVVLPDPNRLPKDDPERLVRKLWVFWTSTRAGNTDIYYETICPRFYARELK